MAAAQRAAAADGLGPDPDPGPGHEVFQLLGRPRYSVPESFSRKTVTKRTSNKRKNESMT